jgi:hypothetical protein
MNTVMLAIGFIALCAAGVSLYVYAGQHRQRKAASEADRVAASVLDYFARSGAQVRVQCHHLQGCVVVLVESEPLKRFRYSHIVEASLISHVEKTLGVHVDRVYWRFPLPVGAASVQDTADLRPANSVDEYVVERVNNKARTGPEYNVAEDTWEQFEKARQVEPSDGDNQER